MSVKGLTSPAQTPVVYDYSATENVKAAEEKEKDNKKENSAAEVGAVYEPSKETVTDSAKKTYKPDTNLINKLKADADARTQQLRSLVEKMMSGQTEAYGKANNIWQFLRSGNYTVDPATKAQAQADIAEDGYWGVKQTSQRIFDFAYALAGDDPDKMKEMEAAVEKGFKQAGEAWGGELPSICGDTKSAISKLFDDYYAKAGAAE